MAVSAQIKMQALVISRLMLEDFDDWKAFEVERETATKIHNRRTARHVSTQIGRSYSHLTNEIRNFIEKNFCRCGYEDLAKLCKEIEPGVGLHVRLDKFEELFFPINPEIKDKVPFYTNVSISLWGLQFEYPEHHFIKDLEDGFSILKETIIKIDDFQSDSKNPKKHRDEISHLIGREKFISRSLVSAAFSLVESYISGLFFTALHLRKLGQFPCDETFLNYAKNKESSALKSRIDQIVKFSSQGKADGSDIPFGDFIRVGKYFRDAIHHTTPFERKNMNLEAGQRLEALYDVKTDVAAGCMLLALDSILKISSWLYGDEGGGEIAQACGSLRADIFEFSISRGLVRFS
ncbi:hypothetical protein [Oceanibaculum nanhaiense]|uniref:hypothetical protein n=1 Tax=Oceanibaculum nanhaiense TaxID=1909734 RepID=UPI003D295C08